VNQEVLYTALVSTRLSSFSSRMVVEDNRIEWVDFMNKCKQTAVRANLDARFIARGIHMETNFYDATQNPTEDMYSFISSNSVLDGLLISIKQPTNVLIADGLINRIQVYGLLGNANINFVNTQYLFWWEHNLKNTSENHSFGYSAYHLEELIESPTPQFDMVFASAHVFSENLDLLQGVVDSMLPGGILNIAASNGYSGIYSSDYKTHDLYPMHELLNEADGSSFHLPYFLGNTIFIKN